jgi:hypothetical protein
MQEEYGRVEGRLGATLVVFLLCLWLAAGCQVDPASPIASRQEALTECPDGSVCFLPNPAMQCGDGSTSGITIRPVAGATKLLVYLEGAGACWDADTCAQTPRHYTAAEAYTASWSGSPWGQWGFFTDPASPLASGYNLAIIPYCTGDVFAGNSIANYDGLGPQYHKGAQSLIAALDQIKALYSAPSQVVLMGSSAGGIAAVLNLRHVVARYPTTPTFLIDDSGTPFDPMYFPASALDFIESNWRLPSTLPADLVVNATGAPSVGDLLHYNLRYTNVRQALLNAKYDDVMYYYYCLVRPDCDLFLAEYNLNFAANVEIGGAANSKVYYTVDDWGNQHCFATVPPSTVTPSRDGSPTLATWLTNMLSGSSAWDNVRPSGVGTIQQIARSVMAGVGHNYSMIDSELYLPGWSFESPYFFLYGYPVGGMVPIYRFVSNADGNSRMLSTSTSQPGYSNEGILGYAQTVGLNKKGATHFLGSFIPIYQLRRQSDYLYTVDATEQQSAIAAGYQDLGVLAYAYSL